MQNEIATDLSISMILPASARELSGSPQYILLVRAQPLAMSGAAALPRPAIRDVQMLFHGVSFASSRRAEIMVVEMNKR